MGQKIDPLHKWPLNLNNSTYTTLASYNIFGADINSGRIPNNTEYEVNMVINKRNYEPLDSLGSVTLLITVKTTTNPNLEHSDQFESEI